MSRVQNMKVGINLKFPPQDRPEFSEVVSNLEECLCNVEVLTSHPSDAPPITVSGTVLNRSSVCLLGS